jgi:hypothetical protein
VSNGEINRELQHLKRIFNLVRAPRHRDQSFHRIVITRSRPS